MKKLLFAVSFLSVLLSSHVYAALGDSLSHVYKTDSNGNDSVGSLNLTPSGTVLYSTVVKRFGSAGQDNTLGGLATTSWDSGVLDGDFTISMWARPQVDIGLDQTLLYARVPGYTNYWLGVFGYSSSGLCVAMYDGPANGNHNPNFCSGSGAFSSTTHMYNIIIQRDTANSLLSLYIDGSYVTGVTDTTVGSHVSNTSLYLGTGADGRVRWGSYADEFYIWQRVLSGTEITDIQTTECPVNCPVSGGGGGGGATSTAILSTVVVPATLSTQQLFVNPVSTTTFSFTSTVASSTGKQAGLIYVVHSSTTTPVITWGGSSVTHYLDTTAINNFVTSLYVINHPASVSPVVISGIVASSTKYIYQSVWDNADLHTVTDTYTVVSGSSRANVFLPSPTVPSTNISSGYSVTGDLFSYILLPNNTELLRATTSDSDFSIIEGQCLSPLDTCGVGYTLPWSLFGGQDGVFNAIGFYATSTVDISSSTSLTSYFGIMGTDAGFQSCFNSGLSFVQAGVCTLKNMVLWVVYLVIPNISDLQAMQQSTVDVITATSSLVTNIFALPVLIGTFSSTSSVPSYSDLNVQIPLVNGQYVSATITPNSSASWLVHIDHAMYPFFVWFFGLITVLYMGYKFIHFIH